MGIVDNAKDVTEYKRAEQALTGQRRVLELLAAGTPLPQVLEALCHSLDAILDGAHCSVLLLDEHGRRLHHSAAPSLPAAYSAAIDGVEIGSSVGSCGTAAFRGEPVIAEDVATDPRWRDFRALALRHGLRACWSVPIRDAVDGRVLGTFAVYYREPRRPGDAEMTTVMEAGHLAGVAIRAKRTEEELRRSEARFRSLVEHSSDLITVVDAAGVRRYASPSYEQVLGYRPEELVGRPIEEINYSEDVDVERQFLADLARRPGAVDRFEIRVHHRDRSTHWLEVVVANRLDDPSVGGFVLNSRDVTQRKRSEEVLRESELRYRALAATAQRQAQEIALLDQVRSALARELDLPALFRTAVDATAAAFGYSLVSLYLLEEDVLVLQHQVGYERVIERVPVSTGVTGRVVRTGRPELITDAAVDPDFLLAVAGITSEVCVPLRDQGRVVGALNLESQSGVILGEDDLRLTRALAEHIDVAIGRARLYAEARASEARLGALVRNAPDLITILDADGAIRYESPAIARVLGYAPEELVGENALSLIHPDDLPRVSSLFAKCLATPGVNVPADFRFPHKDGSWRWLEAVGTNLLDDPSVGGIVVNSRDVTERRRAEERLTHLAYHDPLTGLSNRALFLERLADALARARRGADPVAVLLLDLDGFKLVNDSRGHYVGDRLLTEVGRRLRDSLGPGVTLARLGGDEFAVLREGITDADAGARAAERLIEALRVPFILDGEAAYVGTSVGVAISTRRRSRAGDLMRSADIALYQAKAAGRGTFVVFESRMLAPVRERLTRETALRRALEQDELELHYQPIVELATGRIVRVEALARWAHPERGLLPPFEFIGLAEETGLIVSIGHWALREACRRARQWKDESRTVLPLGMSVNLSSRQLQRTDLAAEVAAALSDAGLDPGQLELEITEGVAMTEAPETRRSLRALRKLGVRLAIDDFGIGYSSLRTLRQLPLDTLKVDASFVAGLEKSPDDRAIVAAVTTLAHHLGLEVTAEGVETAEQAALLRGMGVDRGQGFHFAAPASGEAIGALLARVAPLPIGARPCPSSVMIRMW